MLPLLEELLHMTSSDTRLCSHMQREHKHQRVMITVDLLQHAAWQRCWDPECAVCVQTDGVVGEKYRLQAKHYLGRPPWRREVNDFECEHDLG